MLFVWPYKQAEAKGDELRFSIRSTQRFTGGTAECLVIGDRPAWWGGPWVDCPLISTRGVANHRNRDTWHKLQVVARLYPSFVWMMDDLYFLKPFDAETIRHGRYNLRTDYSSSDMWTRLIVSTQVLLESRGYASLDYAVHWPQFVESANLAKVAYLQHAQFGLWEIMYNNLFPAEVPRSYKPDLCRLLKQPTVEVLDQAKRDAVVLNHVSDAWSSTLRDWLARELPDPHPNERESPQVPEAISRKPANVVAKKHDAPVHYTVRKVCDHEVSEFLAAAHAADIPAVAGARDGNDMVRIIVPAQYKPKAMEWIKKIV